MSRNIVIVDRIHTPAGANSTLDLGIKMMELPKHFAPALLTMMMAFAGLSMAAEEGNEDEKRTETARVSPELNAADTDLSRSAADASGGTPNMPSSTPLRPEGREYGISRAPSSVASKSRKDRSLDERDLWRLEWDNDAFVRTDNGFTAGWSLQRHSRQRSGWREMGPSKFSRWVSRTIPGLEDGRGRIVTRGSGLSQITMTPEDISNPKPQPGDVPWAGSLGWAESWYVFDNDTLNAFQIYAGILGPYSLAEEFQVQIHEWINADEPLGWDNQLKTEPLLNLNYAYKRKLVSAGEYMTKGLAGDIAVGVDAALGNFVTSAYLNLEGRIGWALPKGFVHLADPPGYGIMLNPSEGVPGKLHFYFSVVYRVSATAYSAFLDGNALRDSPHPGIPNHTYTRGTIFGLHAASGPYSIHFNFYSYTDLPIESVNPLTDMTWGNITFEYRY